MSKIAVYVFGGEVPTLVVGPIVIYAILMVIICLTLATWYHHNWKLAGRSSELLSTEVQAAVVDAVISAGAGIGLVSTGLLTGTALGSIVPVADSIVVLILCAFIVRQPVLMFLGVFREIAGGSADPVIVAQVRADTE